MNILKKFPGIILVLILLFSFSACKGKSTADSYCVSREEAVLNVSSDSDKKALYTSKAKDKLTFTAKSDMTELYFDKESCTVSVYDTASGVLWSSLGENGDGEKTSALSVTVLIGGNRYTLSSQGDSVGFSSALYEEKENGITVKYGFKRTLEDETKINLIIPVSYTLKDGTLSVEADLSDIKGEGHDDSVIVTDIEILPFFASCRSGGEGDYMLIPDGCGATVGIGENPTEFEDISLDIYEENNVVGAFGMKKGEGAFVALISDGAELSSVKATKALEKGSRNRVWASFEITPTKENEDKVYVSSKSYEGKITVSYRFLSFENAGYTGMAGAVREMLIRNGSLLSKSSDTSEEYPFNMSVIFDNHLTDSKGRSLSQNLTTYSQAAEMLDSLKAKGIETLNIRLKGILEGDSVSELSFSSRAGSKKELGDFLSYGQTSYITFYTDMGLISSDGTAALEADSQRLGYTAVKNIEKNADEMLVFARDTVVQGICVNDAGKSLYFDISDGAVYLKTDTARVISDSVASLSASKKLMADTGNMYSIKYADSIFNLPVKAKCQSRDICTAVPFIQSVLHGIIDYSVEAVNLSENDEKAFLKSIEYGAVPCYEWYAADLSSSDKTDKQCYINYLSRAQSQYERAAKAFADLRDARITDHYRVRKNVFYTQYDNSTGVYVNYGDKAVTVNGVTVDAMSFVRIN